MYSSTTSPVAGSTRPFHNGWVEWSPSWGLSLRFPGLELRYLGRITNGTGRPNVTAFVVGPLASAGPGGILAIVVIRDEAERHALRRRVQQSQQLESIGRATSGLAHDFAEAPGTKGGLDRALVFLAELLAVAREHLDAVVAEGIVQIGRAHV